MKRTIVLLLIGLLVLTACYPPAALQPQGRMTSTTVESAPAAEPAASVDAAPSAPAPGTLLVDPSIDLGPISPV
jgi:hypothetical protein